MQQLSIEDKAKAVKQGKKRYIRDVQMAYTDFCMTLDEPAEAYLVIEDAIYKWDEDRTPNFDEFIKCYIIKGLEISKKKERFRLWKQIPIEYIDKADGEETENNLQMVIEGGLLTTNEKIYLQGKLQGLYPAEIRRQMKFETYNYIQEYDQVEKSTIAKLQKYSKLEMI